MMPRICLLALIGLPGAGKSTFSASLLTQQTKLNDCNILHVCYDDYIDVPSTTKNAYKQRRLFVYELLAQLIETLQASGDNADFVLPAQVQRASINKCSNDYLIICDDNHYYRSMRYKLYQLCSRFNCAYGHIYISTPLALCQQRNTARASCLPADVLQQMYSRLEVPCAAANAWECNGLTVTLDNVHELPSGQILEFIKQSFDKKCKISTTKVKQPQVQRAAHNLDLLLRARIKTKLQEVEGAKALQVRSQALNEQRKRILEQFRISKQTDVDMHLDYYVNLLT